eukprot:3418751-Rhodomonas_salina.1
MSVLDSERKESAEQSTRCKQAEWRVQRRGGEASTFLPKSGMSWLTSPTRVPYTGTLLPSWRQKHVSTAHRAQRKEHTRTADSTLHTHLRIMSMTKSVCPSPTATKHVSIGTVDVNAVSTNGRTVSTTGGRPAMRTSSANCSTLGSRSEGRSSPAITIWRKG